MYNSAIKFSLTNFLQKPYDFLSGLRILESDSNINLKVIEIKKTKKLQRKFKTPKLSLSDQITMKIYSDIKRDFELEILMSEPFL